MIKSHFNRGSKPHGIAFKSPSLVQSQFQSSTDISEMIRRALMGDRSVLRHPSFINALGSPSSFHDAINKSSIARSIWNDMDDRVKVTFGSPERLVAFIDSHINKDKSPSITDTHDDVTAQPAESSNDSAHAETT